MHQRDLAYDARMRAIKDRNRGGGLVSFGKELLPGVDCIRMVTDGPTVGNAAGCAMDAVPAAGAAKRLVKGARAVKDLDNAADGTRAADRAADARRGFGAAPGAKGDDVAATASAGKGYVNRTPAQATANLERIRASAKPTAGRSPKLARPSPRSQGDSVRTAHGAPAPRATSLADDGLALCRSNSFIPATLVLMGDGTTKRIADVRIGDMVTATDPETGESGPRRVTDTIVGDGIKELVDVQIDRNVITATDRHPFWVSDEGRWVDAEDLEPGDVLLLANGDTVTVEAVSERTEVRRVHNLTVDGIHTYYVLAGDDPVLVHNCGTASPNEFLRTEALRGRASSRTVNEIAESMRANGWVGDPIETFVVNGERYVINGHHRVAAARRAGIDVHYRTLSFDELQAYGYGSSDDVIAAWAPRGPDRLRP